MAFGLYLFRPLGRRDRIGSDRTHWKRNLIGDETIYGVGNYEDAETVCEDVETVSEEEKREE